MVANIVRTYILETIQLFVTTRILHQLLIYLGNGVLIAPGVLIIDNSHGTSDINDLVMNPRARHLASNGPVIIDDNVWIGERAMIMPGVHIGKGSIIGAGSVVTHDVPPFLLLRESCKNN